MDHLLDLVTDRLGVAALDHDGDLRTRAHAAEVLAPEHDHVVPEGGERIRFAILGGGEVLEEREVAAECAAVGSRRQGLIGLLQVDRGGVRQQGGSRQAGHLPDGMRVEDGATAGAVEQGADGDV